MSTIAVLQSHALYVGRLKIAADLESGTIQSATPFSDGDAPASGWFLEMADGGWFGLFFAQDAWFLFVDTTVFPAASVLNLDLSQVAKDTGTITFSLADGDRLEATYVIEQRIPYDPTPFIEDDDLDFGLFLKERLLDPEKLERMAMYQREKLAERGR